MSSLRQRGTIPLEAVRDCREPQPSASVLATQSVKTSTVGGPREYDGANKLSGTKHHLLVDPPKSRSEWQPRGDIINDLCTVYFEWVRVPPQPKKFRGHLPRRLVAKRTIGWLSLSRRLSKDYERPCESSQAMIYAVMGRLMLRRLARV